MLTALVIILFWLVLLMSVLKQVVCFYFVFVKGENPLDFSILSAVLSSEEGIGHLMSNI